MSNFRYTEKAPSRAVAEAKDVAKYFWIPGLLLSGAVFSTMKFFDTVNSPKAVELENAYEGARKAYQVRLTEAYRTMYPNDKDITSEELGEFSGQVRSVDFTDESTSQFETDLYERMVEAFGSPRAGVPELLEAKEEAWHAMNGLGDGIGAVAFGLSMFFVLSFFAAVSAYNDRELWRK